MKKKVYKPKYKEMYLFQKRMSLISVTINLILIFMLSVLILDKLASMEILDAQHQLNRINDKIQAQAASDFQEMYDNKPPEYKLPDNERQMIQAVFGDKADQAINIVQCESSFRNDARNPNSSATGLFQVLSKTHGVRADWLENPLINTLVAKQLYDNRGNWGAWRDCAGRLGYEI